MPQCPGCGRAMAPHVFAADRTGGGPVAIRRCPACGLCHTDAAAAPPPAAATCLPPRGPLRWVADAIIRYELGPVRILPVGGSILDVGAGSGGRSLRLRRWGYHVTALEPDRAEASTARVALPTDVAVVNATLEEWAGGEEMFDGALMSHVLEHLADPEQELAALRGRLRPGGVLIVTVPNAGGAEARLFRGRWHGWEPARHRWHYTAHALGQLLQRAGYQDVRVRAHGGWMYPASLTYSLLPGLDPQVTTGARARAGRLVAAALIPLALLEVAAGRGPQLVAIAVSPPVTDVDPR